MQGLLVYCRDCVEYAVQAVQQFGKTTIEARRGTAHLDHALHANQHEVWLRDPLLQLDIPSPRFSI
jgi:hypothetical protein